MEVCHFARLSSLLCLHFESTFIVFSAQVTRSDGVTQCNSSASFGINDYLCYLRIYSTYFKFLNVINQEVAVRTEVSTHPGVKHIDF